MTGSERNDMAKANARRAGCGWRWRWWLSVCMLLMFALPGLPAGAQQPADTPPPPGTEAAREAADAQRASYATLADLLDNDTERARLVEQLRELAAQQDAGQAQAGANARAITNADRAGDAGANTNARTGPDPGLNARIAGKSQAFVAGLAASARATVETLRELFTGRIAGVVRLPDWPGLLADLAWVVAATAAAFLVLRAIAARLYARMERWMGRLADEASGSGAPASQAPEPDVPTPGTQAGAGAAAPAGRHAHLPLDRQLKLFYGRALVVVGSLLVDIAAVALAAAAGYGAALLLAAAGRPGRFETTFVNAFVVVEIGKVLVRMIFARRYSHLRLFPMSDEVARYWNDRIHRLVSVGGYGVLLAAPLLEALFSPELGRAFGLVVTLAVYCYAVRLVWKNRDAVRERIRRRAEHAGAFSGTVLRMLARAWHLAAIAYCTAMLVVSQVDPADALPYMVYGTVQSALAIGIGLLLSAALTGLLSRRLALPGEVRARLPMLEARLNAYIPLFLRGLRLLILVVVTLFVLDAWRVFRLSDWLASGAGTAALATLVRVAIVLLAAAAAWTLLASVIEHRLSSQGGQEPSARERTLLALFRNAALVLIATMTILIVLSQIGIDIGPLIAGAGVVGLAIGFGAQKLVQDVINGVFIQLENGMNQNDVVEVAGVFGTVEKITIRSVGIRTLDGGYHMIPFSSVDKVSNHMRDFSYHLGEYTIAYRESVDDAAYHLERAFEELMTDPVLAPEILEDMTIAGVTSLNERGFTIRVLIKTKPGMQWAVQRGYNRLVKKHFNAAGIELPYPHAVVYFGQDRDGKAPPMRVRGAGRADAEPAGSAAAPGHMRRPLQPETHDRSADVLGNELATVVDEEGKVQTHPGTASGRDAAEEDEGRGERG